MRKSEPKCPKEMPERNGPKKIGGTMYNKAVREEGKAARLFGRAVEDNPYHKYLASPECKNPDEAIMWEHASEWRTGWLSATEREVARARMQWHRLTGTEMPERNGPEKIEA